MSPQPEESPPSLFLSSLIALPTEIRHEIYYYAIFNHLQQLRPTSAPNANPIICKRRDLRLPLFQSDPFFLADATPILLKKFTLNFASVGLILALLPSDRTLIKRVELRIDISEGDMTRKIKNTLKKLLRWLPSLEAVMLHLEWDTNLSEGGWRRNGSVIRNSTLGLLYDGLKLLMERFEKSMIWVGWPGHDKEAQMFADELERRSGGKLVVAKASSLRYEEGGDYTV